MGTFESVLVFVQNNVLAIALLFMCIYGVTKVVKTTFYAVLISVGLILVASYFGYNYSSIKDTVILFFN